MDGVTWSTVTSSDGSPKLFAGSADRHTPVTSYVTPSITAVHIRINPQSWRGHIFIRFDIGGCQVRKLKRRRSNFARKFVNPTEDMRGSHLVTKRLTSQSECAKICHKNNACMAFTVQTETQFCTGYSVWNVVPGNMSNPEAAFVSLDFFDVYGYKEEQNVNMLYNVNEVKATKMAASATCTSQGTQLITIDTEAKMTKIWTYINGIRVLKHNNGMYVSGTYRSGGLWVYESTRTAINSALWSPNNPDSSTGSCVMLKKDGLASADCGQKRLSICGY
ncbi:uncharacterized protein [Argopecten irradians]|uniref:uncharacterized protein n=1 Tax=Argopecten irradians TaxID=31199 RepID=UPI003710B432